MPLTLVLGRAGSGKSEYCLTAAHTAEQNGARVLMLVPEQYSHSGERAFLERTGYIHDGFLVTSFQRFAHKLILNSGAKRTYLDSTGKAMLMFRAINSVKKDLLFYASLATKPGYLTLFMDAISEFKKGQVTPESLKSAAQAAKEPLTTLRLLDLARIYEAYNKLLGTTLTDGDDDLTFASSLIFDMPHIKNTEIYIDEFYRFTQNELSMISAFLAAGAHVTVSLCMDESAKTHIFQSTRKTKQALVKLAKEIGAQVLPPVLMPQDTLPRYKAPALSVLERALSGENVSQNDTGNALSLYIAKGKYEEVAYAATQIKQYIKETGARFSDIAVIAGDYDGYAELVQSVFPAYDIPVFADTRLSFLDHPIVLYLSALFDLLQNTTTKHVIAYMKSGFSCLSPEEAFRLENYALAGAIEYGDWKNDERFLKKANGIFAHEDEDNEESLSCLNAKNRLLAPVFALKERMQNEKTIHARIEALLAFFDQTGLYEKIETRIAHFAQDGMMKKAAEYDEVYKILTETLYTMSQLLGNETAGIHAIRAILEAGLSTKSIGTIPTVYDQIAFGDLNRSVIKNVRALFVLGANDGLLPPSPDAGALLSDSERAFLLAQGISIAPDTKKRLSDAEFSLYAAMCVSRERLYVSYPTTDDTGAGLRPALFITKLKRTFLNIPVTHELNKDEQSAKTCVASVQSAYNYVLTHLHTLHENKTAKALYDVLMQDETMRERLVRAQTYKNFKNETGRLSPETVHALYGNELYGSVSRFERFASCPFSFFLEYGLGAKERKVLKIEAPDIGSLLHDIIERFSKALVAQGKSFRTVTKEEQRALCDSIIDEMFGAMFIKNMYSTGRLEALKKRLKSLVAKSVHAICDHVARGEFEPAAFEIAFDKNGELPPVTITLADGSLVTMRGRIDRIDTFTHEGKLYLKIIDYKSGNKGYSLADIFNGTTLQLAVYAVAATNGLSKTQDTGFGGMFYFRLDDPVKDSAPDTAQDDAEDIKSFKMSGLAPDDPTVIRAITGGEGAGWSAVIPVYMKNDGTVSKSQSKTASGEEFQKLVRYIKKTLQKIGGEILSGTVAPYPAKNGKTLPCTYCKYASVCGFDPDVHRVRKTETFRSDEEIWERME